MLYSSFTGRSVELPLNSRAYERHLKRLIAGSRRKKPRIRAVTADLSDSWTSP
jgi:hypothetical protein